MRPKGWRALALALLAAGAPTAGWPAGPAETYRAELRPPASLEAILRHVQPGQDGFPDEKEAEELAARLRELAARLRRGDPATVTDLLAPGFEGGRLRDPAEAPSGEAAALSVLRTGPPAPGLVQNARAFVSDLTAFLSPLGPLRTAEFLITGIEVKREDTRWARTQVRYDLVGEGPGTARAERVGRFTLEWRARDGGPWGILKWTRGEDVLSRSPRPAFTEVTGAALSRSPVARGQLAHGLDAWLATLDSAFMLASMGHHGVSVADVDGDGWDDVYVAQPAGLPNRLFRNRGDGTFEDVTEAAGLLILDDTSHSLFGDLDNDGDQDVVLVSTIGALAFRNDGRGRFAVVPDAFRLKLSGTPISAAMADYDRDGFLDLYLCTYSYFVGTSEDKAGSPNPYHDAQNGPPNVLLRNDGQGRFADVTREAGLDAGNDRFSFAASFADYDEDGWPDLFVANDFGRKNLYRNLGGAPGRVTFQEVTAAAGVEDHGPGMSAAFLDYDGDGRLDILAGNMWTANGQRITAEAGFLPGAPEEVRALFRRHARGNSLFRNRGDGTFEDVSLAARAEMGRWAWSSDALDFDNDGNQDLYVVNGMFTRAKEEDLDGFFWRQVVARSPLARATGTPYDEAWRAVNRLLADHSQASHERNVFLRNDGRGGFDEVAGTVGLDLDQDGRSFSVFDADGDGDSDLVVMAARSSPQLRFFRNDLEGAGASLALRLSGRKGNRDAIGARVVVETDVLRRTRILQAGSGFISQHSKELLLGLGRSTRVSKLTVFWPGGGTQTFTDLPVGQRLVLVEGEEPRAEPFRTGAPLPIAATPAAPAPPTASWLYEPCPAPEVELLGDGPRQPLSSGRGRPGLLVLATASSLGSLQDLAAGARDLEAAGMSLLAVALDPPEDAAKVAAAARGLRGLRVVQGRAEVGLVYTVLHHNLFVGKQDLRLPTAFLLNARGEIVRVYRGAVGAAEVVADAPRADVAAPERLARAVPFPGTFYAKPGSRNDLQYGLELVEQGLEDAALPAFERAARGDPSAFTLYSLGTLYMKRGRNDRAQAAFVRALEVKPDFAEASNGLGALLGQGGNLPAAVARFRMALEATPEYPDALNNLGYALMQQGQGDEARRSFERALSLQPDFPEAFNNLGIHRAREGDPAGAESYFKKAVAARAGYGEAANNLALVLLAREDVAGATSVLQRVLEENPGFETSYVTLARIYLGTGRPREGVQVLERLLQRNPSHAVALQMAREAKAGR